MPAGSLSTYLAHVAVSSRAQNAFIDDPAKAIQHAGLNEASRAAVLSKDPGAIRDAILAEKGIQPGVAAAGDIEVVIVVVI